MRVSQDSRTIGRGDWFVAVKGEECDGHEFVDEALKRGAAGVLEIADLYGLAREKLRKLPRGVIAITGSYGKSTTKKAVAGVLSSKFKVFGTEGNVNTPRGTAIEVVNNLRPDHEILVAEVGMDRLGEIAESGAILKPQVGIVTSVGEMHLEKLGTLANIKKAKSELLKALPNDGVAILNGDDCNVRKIADVFSGRKIWYGLRRGADVGCSCIGDLNRELAGKGNLYAALAAFAVGTVFGISEDAIIDSLAGFEPPRGRLSFLRGAGGAIVIDDTYNAGPRSVRVALDVLAATPAKRRIAVLGDMLELGKLEKGAHLDAVARALEVADLSILVGERMIRACNRLNPRGLATLAGDAQGAVRTLDGFNLGEGDVSLVKGSRGMRMEEVVAALLGEADAVW